MLHRCALGPHALQECVHVPLDVCMGHRLSSSVCTCHVDVCMGTHALSSVCTCHVYVCMGPHALQKSELVMTHCTFN